MKAVVQRVIHASVEIGGKIHAEIGRGMVILLGVEKGDETPDVDFLAGKIAGLRIFEDDAGKMNLSAGDVSGEALLVSQFTICGDCRKGRRPSFDNAAPPEHANTLYEQFAAKLAETGLPVKTGVFQAEMLVNIANDGPVTFIITSR